MDQSASQQPSVSLQFRVVMVVLSLALLLLGCPAGGILMVLFQATSVDFQRAGFLPGAILGALIGIVQLVVIGRYLTWPRWIVLIVQHIVGWSCALGLIPNLLLCGYTIPSQGCTLFNQLLAQLGWLIVPHESIALYAEQMIVFALFPVTQLIVPAVMMNRKPRTSVDAQRLSTGKA